MARSRRRSASRSSSNRASSGWLNVATMMKIGAACLVAGAGTYGVFYSVSNMPAGAQNITEGVEVGEFADSAIAMTQKPPLPEDTGATPTRFASAANTMPTAAGPTNPLAPNSKPADNPIQNVFAQNQTANEKKPSLPSALPSPENNKPSYNQGIVAPPKTPEKIAATPAGTPSSGLPKTPNSVPGDLKPAALSGVDSAASDLLAKSAAPALLNQPPTGPTANPADSNPPRNNSPSSDALLNTLRATASNNAPKLPGAAHKQADTSSPMSPPKTLLSQSLTPRNNSLQSPDQQKSVPSANSATGFGTPANGIPSLPPNNALAGISKGSAGSLSNRPGNSPPNPFLQDSTGGPERTAPSGLSSSGLSSSLPDRRGASPLDAAEMPSVSSPTTPARNPFANNSPVNNTPSIPRNNTLARATGRSNVPNNALSVNTQNNFNNRPRSNAELSADNNVRPAGYPNSPANSSDTPTRRPASSLVSNQPGEPQWEIQQNAAIVLEKRAPEQVQVNVPATFVLVVRNVGRVPAAQVLVRDRIPKGARLVRTTPQPTRQEGDLLEWDLATLPPGETLQITTELIPTERGELGSVAEVSMAAVAACRTRCTQPKLVIEHTAPPQVLVGQQVVMNITVRNEGDGPAENVTIRETVPSQLRHQSGNEIENPIGRLLPGESRNLQLPLLATQAGQVQNTVRVSGEGKLSDEHSVRLQIVAPSLQVNMDGPTRRYLSRQAVHQMAVKNNGTANATNVQMMAQLPRGLKYESSSPAGRYDSSRHAVFWAIQQLPSQQSEQLSITTLPLAPGEQVIKFQALADLNQPQEAIHKLMVEQLSELFFEVDDVDDPIEINSNTTYVVRLENQGSQVANDVAMIVDLPNGIEPLRVDGSVQYEVQNSPAGGKRIVFAPIAVLNPGAKLATQIQVRGTLEGDHKIEVQLTSAQRTAAVAKQEITKVYSDLR